LFGLTPSQMLEGMFALWASGGERCDDLEHFRKDLALAQLIGFIPPSPQTARDFFEKFHREGAPPIWKSEHCSIPEENTFLTGLASVNRTIIAHVQTRSTQPVATIDMDAVIVECDKRDARTTYEGTRGYQPVVAFWAEQELILADEYRDGNIPAGCGNLRVLKKALANLPPFITEINLRMDSAGHENELMDYADEEGIRYAISADMTAALRNEAMSALSDYERQVVTAAATPGPMPLPICRARCASPVPVPRYGWRKAPTIPPTARTGRPRFGWRRGSPSTPFRACPRS